MEKLKLKIASEWTPHSEELARCERLTARLELLSLTLKASARLHRMYKYPMNRFSRVKCVMGWYLSVCL